MPKLNLTDLALQRLKPTDKQETYFDNSLPGFGIRVGKHRKTFIVLKGKERKRVSLGHYPMLSLKDARNAARIELIQVSALASKSYSDAVLLFTEASKKKTKATMLISTQI